MDTQIPFIGRTQEIQIITKSLDETNSLIYVFGEGGVGKTRLLTEIFEKINSSSSFFCFPIIDFDDRAISDFSNFQFRLIEILSDKEIPIDRYLSGMQDIDRMRSAGVSSEGINLQENQLVLELVKIINKLAIKKQVVFFIDTVEKIENEIFWNRFSEFYKKLRNINCILFGRENNNLIHVLESNFNKQFNYFKLEPLSLKDSKQYLKKKEELLHTNIKPVFAEKLLRLSDGRPILIDLAVEFAARRISLDWISKLSLKRLNKENGEEFLLHKAEFEKQLVSNISQIRKPIHRLVLSMARIYPINKSMIASLFQVSDDEAEEIFDDAQTYVFIKPLTSSGYITLHDEMRDMINLYIWPDLDPNEVRRKTESDLATQIYLQEEKKISSSIIDNFKLNSFERKKLETQREAIYEQIISHSLYSDLSTGFIEWKRIIDFKRASKDISFASHLLNYTAKYSSNFSEDQRFEFLLTEARLANDNGNSLIAESKLKEALSRFGGVKNRDSSIYNALGIVEEKLGNLQSALDYQIKCFDIVKETNPKSAPYVANRIGYLYRLMGQKDEAEKFYLEALKENSEIPSSERDENLTASLFNNLGYISGLRRKFLLMDSQCDKAMEIWTKIGMYKQIGRSEVTRAIFYRDQGNYQSALRLLKQAISRYVEPDDHEQLCRAYFHLGWTQWYIAEKVNDHLSDISLLEWDKGILREALEYFIKSLNLARKYVLRYELPGILHQTATVYWYLGRTLNDNSMLENARKLNDESYSISVETHDMRYAIDSLVGYAEWDYDLGVYDKIPEYDKKLQTEYGKYRYQYELYFGRMHRINADIAFQHQEFEKAFSNYSIGLAMISDHHGFSRYSIQRELLRLTGKIKQLNKEDIKKWVNYLKSEWLLLSKEKNQDVKLLLDWCEQFDIPGYAE